MKLSIRNKLIMAISLLMVVIFSIAAYLFISEKKVEMAEEIYGNTRTFARLSASTVVKNYDLYLAQNSFVYFNREIRSLLEENENIQDIQVISYDGKILYDSALDIDKRYEGEPRLLTEADLNNFQTENVVIKTLDGRTVFLRWNKDNVIEYLDKNEQGEATLERGVMIEYIVVPVSEKYSVLYGVNYENLYQSLRSMRLRIIYLAVFAVMLGMILSFLMSTQLVRPIRKLVAGADEVAKGNLKARVDIRTRDEMSFLGAAFNKMTEDLEKSIADKLYKERVAHELKIASDIQKRIIPEKTPNVGGLDIAADIIPAGEIGGDMYDFIQLPEEKMLMYLGDVTGHGVPAGIVSSIANALFFGYAGAGDLQKLMVDVNRVMKAKTMSNMFMTLCLLEWNGKTGTLNYVNAGHEPILHYKASGKKVLTEPSGGIALGMVDDVSKMLKVQSLALEAGDFIVLYSDGIPEAWKNANESYGMERFVDAVARAGELPTANAIKDAILADVKAFVGEHEQADDITILVIKRK